MTVQRTAVNPWPWSAKLGYHQGEIVSGHTRTLYCAGQAAMSADGRPRHAGDMAAQLALSLDNLEAVLGEAGMTLANLVRLNVYTTDADRLFEHYGVLAARLGAAGVAPATTLLGVTRLAIPGLMVELEGTAVAVMRPTIVTVGVYGFDAGTFLRRLRQADVRLLLDLRQRRGVRGAEYAWANSARLQHLLAEAGIGYRHVKELAPTTELRRVQYREDDRQGVGKRNRVTLSPEYASRYVREILDPFDLGGLVAELPDGAVTALFCVERDPQACHRSLVAERLRTEHGLSVTDLLADPLRQTGTDGATNGRGSAAGSARRRSA